MFPKQVTWGRIRLEIGKDRLWFRFAGSPLSGALGMGLILLVTFGIFFIAFLVTKEKIPPAMYLATAIAVLFALVMGAAMGKQAKQTAFVISLNPSPCLSLMQGEQAIVLPAEEILRFVTSEREDRINDTRVTYYSLVVETRRGEFVVLPEALSTKKGAETFGRLFTALLLEKAPFNASVREMLELRDREYAMIPYILVVLVTLLVLTIFFVSRYI